ncbi:hypothetical protein Q3G72_024326 [Acer saccharum]|nr:hypothetical protein Q3G72_024326 [Acer saccharum]
MEICPQEVGAKLKLAWIDMYSVPLRCWNDSFFMRVGRMLGIPLFIAEDTMKRYRLDRGRMLISIPLDCKCLQKIKVLDCSRSFEVFIVEVESQVDEEWIRSYLGLWNGFFDSNSNSSTESESCGRSSEKVGAQVHRHQQISTIPNKSHSFGMGCQDQHAFRKERGKAFHNSRYKSREEANKEVNLFPPQSKERSAAGAYAVKETVDKGKKVMQKIHRERKYVPRRSNAAMILEKKRVAVSSDGEFSLSSSEASGRIRYPMGECSKLAQNKEDIGPVSSRVVKRPSGQSANSVDSDEEGSPSDEESGPDYGSMVPETDLDPTLNGPNNYDPLLLTHMAEPNQLTGRNLIEFDPQNEQRLSQTRRLEPIHLEVDLGLLHCREKLNVSMDDEMTRVIENQYVKRYGRLGDNMDTLSLEMEISKVLETGVALEFDFHGRETELSQFIAQREEEDIARFQEVLNT